MMNLTNFFIIISLIFFSWRTDAQFKKYKSRTKLDKGTTDKSKDKSKNDFFGRDGSGIISSKLPQSKTKYVNLNPETAFGPEVITSFDFPETDILSLTKHMQKLTGLNLILDKSIKGKITIMAPTPITVGDAWKAYLTALNIHGYSLVKTGAFYKVIQSRDIRYAPTKIYTGAYVPDTDNYVMRIMTLKNVSSSEITRQFRSFMSRFGRISEIKETNTVIISETGSNINRLVKIIKFIDVPGHEESLQIIKVEHSSAQEIATMLDKILKGTGRPKRRVGNVKKSLYDLSDIKLISEPRTNSIIAMANHEGARQLRSLIKKLDVKLESRGADQIHVYYLNYGDADTLGKTLSALVSSATSAAQKTKSRFASKSGDVASLFSSAVKITSDKANNALVVMASPTDYLTIRRIIEKLDIPRDQVYVEGLIMETQVSSGSSYGISILGAYGTGNARRFGSAPGGSGDLVNLLTENITNLSGLFYGVGMGKKVVRDIGGKSMEIHTVNGLIKAIAGHSSTNILATPQILALDNEEASFEVGETVPTLVRETAANGSSVNSSKPQKAALSLKITPQINKTTHMIKLKINYKINEFSKRSVAAEMGLGTTDRQAITKVIVRDQDTIAMGGLMRDKNTLTESKVPLLGDIPILGWLFKTQDKTSEKVNLLLFLTPKILAPYEKATAQTTKGLLSRRAAHLKKYYGHDEDPFGSTVKGLYNKVEKQEKGPLYDPSISEDLKQSNAGARGIGGETPDYKKIQQDVAQNKKKKEEN